MWAGLSRKGPRRAPAPLSVVVLDDRGLEELGPELRIRFVVSPPERGPCPRVALAHASHLRAQVHRVEVHRNTVRLKDTHELVSDLDTDALLDGETPCEYPHQPGQLGDPRSEEHTSELQSRFDLVCRLLLEKKKIKRKIAVYESAKKLNIYKTIPL